MLSCFGAVAPFGPSGAPGHPATRGSAYARPRQGRSAAHQPARTAGSRREQRRRAPSRSATGSGSRLRPMRSATGSRPTRRCAARYGAWKRKVGRRTSGSPAMVVQACSVRRVSRTANRFHAPSARPFNAPCGRRDAPSRTHPPIILAASAAHPFFSSPRKRGTSFLLLPASGAHPYLFFSPQAGHILSFLLPASGEKWRAAPMRGYGRIDVSQHPFAGTHARRVHLIAERREERDREPAMHHDGRNSASPAACNNSAVCGARVWKRPSSCNTR